VERGVAVKALISLVGRPRATQLLGEHLTQARRRRIDRVLGDRLSSIAVAVEDPYDPRNAAAIVRTAEAVGLAEVHAISRDSVLEGRKTARGAATWIDRHHHSSLDDFLRVVRQRGMRVVGACVEEEMTTMLADVPVDQPLCLLVGNEREGLSAAAREGSDLLFRIPMYGMVESLNVSVATAVALFDLSQRRRRWLGQVGDLEDEERADRRISWYAQSLDERLVAGLVATLQAAKRSL
jgi:tRNA (guanosine-2'-O-)-methyltransferase